MAAKRPVFTENFARNLDAIRLFLGASERSAFERLNRRLFQEVVPTLRRLPHLGRDFLAHSVRSREARTLARKLRRRLERGDEIREFLVEDYLVLYLVQDDRLVFLSIKHHRQLSFDLHRFWREPQGREG